MQMDEGGAILAGGPSMPPGILQALERYFTEARPELAVRRVQVEAGPLPVEIVAAGFGLDTPDVATLASCRELLEHVALVEFPEELGGELVKVWRLFVRRFAKARAEHWGALAILVLPGNAGVEAFMGLSKVAWNGRLRRIDAAIWANTHAPAARGEPLDALAEALAVELGGWNLCLVERIARARDEDLLEPNRLLESLLDILGHPPGNQDSLDGHGFTCSLRLLETKEDALLTRRIWRAHLRALFPWIEEVRQKVIARYSRRLTVDHFQRDLGAKTVEDIEFGGIVKQLISTVQPREGDFLRTMWNMRNDLAHRKPAAGSDLKQALDLAGILGFAEQL